MDITNTTKENLKDEHIKHHQRNLKDEHNKHLKRKLKR
jgi:hypothetical protein